MRFWPQESRLGKRDSRIQTYKGAGLGGSVNVNDVGLGEDTVALGVHVGRDADDGSGKSEDGGELHVDGFEEENVVNVDDGFVKDGKTKKSKGL